MELWRLDATDLAAQIRSGRASARDATAACLGRLEAVNPQLNAIVHVLADEAMAAAAAADEAQARGEALGPLHGVPATIKIVADQKGCATDNGVAMFKSLIAKEDAPVVANLRRAGAILVGRTAAPAFSMRAMTSSVLHGQTYNPWNPGVTCGGSSGGAAAGLAAGIGAIAHGSDIGGSIRWPAYCNGVVGLRTSLGRIPSFNPTARNGRNIASQMMAVAGPLTRSVRDARLALQVMSAGDPRDPVWTPVPLEGPPTAKRVALVAEPAGFSIHPAVSDAIRIAGQRLAEAGYQVEEVEPPNLRETAELWEHLGLPHFGISLVPILEQVGDPGLTNFITHWIAEKGLADMPTFLNAFARRDQLLSAWNLFFETYPVILAPNCPEPSLPAELDTQGRDGALRTLEGIRLQFMCPVLGLPGLSVPLGRYEGLPLGVQVIAARYREDLCLTVGEIIEAHEPIPTPIDPR
ncbi:MAG: amidase [Alphaproteobacteria bacterium]